MIAETDATICQIEFELEKAERGMAMPYDAERVGRCARCWSRRGSGSYRRGWRGAEDYLTGTRADANAPVA